MASPVPGSTPDSASPTPAPPAYFLSLTIANFRCFGPEQTLDLSDGKGRPARWTVLLGENGVGKTTLLQCLGIIQPRRTNYFNQLMPLFFTVSAADGVIDWAGALRNDPQPTLLNYEYIVGERLNTLQSTSRGTVHSYRTQGSSAGIPFPPFDEDSAGLICYGYGANRRSRRPSLTEPRNDKDVSITLFDDTAELLNAEEWLAQIDYATTVGSKDVREQSGKRKQNILSLLTSDILPDVEELRFGSSDLNDVTPRVEAKTPYGWVRLNELSLGYRTALTWIVDLASRMFDRYPDSPNPLAEPAIVLVDEIDLHLHPKWQRELVQKLTETFPSTQFIVTAHSPLIVQSAPDANLALLRREGDHVVIDNDVDEIRNWRVDQILTSDLFGLETARPPRLEPLFEERRRILSQPTLSEADRQRLGELEQEIGDAMPLGETPADIRAMDALRRVAATLERKAQK